MTPHASQFDQVRDVAILRRTLLRRSVWLATALGGTSLLAACAAPTTPTTAPPSTPTAAAATGGALLAAPTSAPAVPAGAASATFNGTITEGQNGEGKINNPILFVDVDGAWHTDLMFDPLVDLDARTLKPVPRLAKSWDVSTDGLTYTFHLQDGVKWHDGRPFTAEDTRFTVLSILSPDYIGPFRKDWSVLAGAPAVIAGSATDFDGVKVLDANTIQFRLAEPDATFMTVVVPNLKSMPKHLLEGQKITAEIPFSLAPVGTGPYRFVEWKKGDTFVMEANTAYWGKPAASVKRIVQRLFPDQQALVLALESGNIDYSINVPPAQLGRLSSLPQLAVLSAPPQNYDAFQLNLQHPQLKDPRVRQAIAYAFDRETFSRENTNGFLKPAQGIIGWGSWAFDASAKGLPFDMARARQLLADAGHPNGGFSLRIVTNVGNNLRAEAATILQAQLKTLGITASVELSEFGKLLSTMTEGSFDIGVLPFNSAYPDPDRLSLYFHSAGANNYYKYSNPRVDALFAEARKINDFDQRKALYLEIQQAVMTDLPVIPLYDYPNLVAINKKFKGLEPSALGQRWNIKDWTVA